MKQRIFFHIIRSVLCIVFCFTMGCNEESRIDLPGNNSHNLPDLLIERWWDDPSMLSVPEDAISVAEAIRICKGLSSGEKTSQYYYIKGLVHSMITKYTSVAGGATFYMVDNPSEHTPQFQAFKIQNYGNKPFKKGITINKGNWVVIYGQLTNYNGTFEVAAGSAYLYSSTYVDTNLTNNGSLEQPFTVEDVTYLRGERADKRYYVKGYVIGVSTYGENVNSTTLQLQPDQGGIFSSITHYLIASDTTMDKRIDSIKNISSLSSEEQTQKIDSMISNHIVAIELPGENKSDLRNMFKLNDAANVKKIWHKEILLYGILEDFLKINGVTHLSYIHVNDIIWGDIP